MTDSNKHDNEQTFSALADVIHRLRAPGGCPWDREQTHESLKPFIIEEAWELCDAIDGKNPGNICEELGDLLLQILLQAEIAEEKKNFDIKDVCNGIRNKLIHRHPHVFGDTNVSGSSEVVANWENIKRTEKKERTGHLSGVPDSFPALFMAHMLSRRASRVGFDWKSAREVREKVYEELKELEQAVSIGNTQDIENELGDLLFSIANYARHLDVEPEQALRKTCRKFRSRFESMEAELKAQGTELTDAGDELLDELWEKAKQKQF